MSNWEVVLTKQAQKDLKKLVAAGLKQQVIEIFTIIAENPYEPYPPYEKLIGNLAGLYSRRINIQHRLVYQVLEASKTVKVLRMWTHYE